MRIQPAPLDDVHQEMRDAFELRQQAGHADIRTTQRYVVDDGEKREAAVLELPRLGVKTA
jgi:hypothetical protein